MNIVLDIDDLSVTGFGFDQVKMLKEHYPNLKVTFFTIPLDQAVLRGAVEDKKTFEWAKIINEYDWIEICPHGLIHIMGEMDVDYDKACKIIDSVEKRLKGLKLDFKKIWKSPFWQTSDETYKALRDRGYVVATDRNAEKPDIKGLEQYRFNWSIDEPLPDLLKVIKAHGHLNTTDNAIIKALPNFLDQVPSDANFMFISEYLNEHGPD